VRTSAPGASAPRQRRGSKALIQTPGPAPDDTLASIKLTVGVIAGTHGVNGELKLKLLTDHPEHLPTIRSVYLGESDEPTAVKGFRFQGDQGLIQLEGVDNPEDGKRLGGLKVRILGSDAAPLEEGEYFLFQLIGLTAETESGERLGVVSDLLETGAHDVLVIQPDSGDEILVPNHPEYVREVVPDEGRIVVVPPVYLN
jgi:16S rRNA processing protein RimM